VGCGLLTGAAVVVGQAQVQMQWARLRSIIVHARGGGGEEGEEREKSSSEYLGWRVRE
jgi:hypothetical protein